MSGEHSKWRQRFRFRSLCISWQLWDHLASLLIVTRNKLKVPLDDQNLKSFWPSAFSCYLCSCFLSHIGITRDFPWCTDFHTLSSICPPLFPDPTLHLVHSLKSTGTSRHRELRCHGLAPVTVWELILRVVISKGYFVLSLRELQNQYFYKKMFQDNG